MKTIFIFLLTKKIEKNSQKINLIKNKIFLI